jgi:hypothetical protein
VLIPTTEWQRVYARLNSEGAVSGLKNSVTTRR